MSETFSPEPAEPVGPDPEEAALDPKVSPPPRFIWPLLFWAGAALLLVVGGLLVFLGTVGAALAEMAPELAALGGSLAGMGLLLALAGWVSWQHAQGQPLPAWMTGRTRLSPAWGWLLWLGILALGMAWSTIVPIAWWGWGAWFFHPLAMGLPSLLLAWELARRYRPGRPWRHWLALHSGLFAAPAFVVSIELFGLVLVGGVLALLWREHLPQLLAALERGDRTGALVLLLPLLRSPWMSVLGLGFLGVFVPLVEEAFKPLYVWWLVAREDLTAQEGLVLGALAGAGYGLFEALSLGATAEGWATFPLTRGLTTVLHIALTALVGVGLVRGVVEQHPWLAGGHYALAVLLHGVWNAAVAVNAVATSGLPLGLTPALAKYALGVQGLAGVGCLSLLLWVLRKSTAAEGAVDNPPQSGYH